MSNHPGRKPGSAERMTPDELRALIEGAGITQARAAGLAGVSDRTMRQYLAGDRKIAISASSLLVVCLIMMGADPGPLMRYLPEDTRGLIDGTTPIPEPP